jgi:hypothetical protein
MNLANKSLHFFFFYCFYSVKGSDKRMKETRTINGANLAKAVFPCFGKANKNGERRIQV